MLGTTTSPIPADLLDFVTVCMFLKVTFEVYNLRIMRIYLIKK